MIFFSFYECMCILGLFVYLQYGNLLSICIVFFFLLIIHRWFGLFICVFISLHYSLQCFSHRHHHHHFLLLCLSSSSSSFSPSYPPPSFPVMSYSLSYSFLQVFCSVILFTNISLLQQQLIHLQLRIASQWTQALHSS